MACICKQQRPRTTSRDVAICWAKASEGSSPLTAERDLAMGPYRPAHTSRQPQLIKVSQQLFGTGDMGFLGDYQIQPGAGTECL